LRPELLAKFLLGKKSAQGIANECEKLSDADQEGMHEVHGEESASPAGRQPNSTLYSDTARSPMMFKIALFF
jgi:hypothetical protein